MAENTAQGVHETAPTENLLDDRMAMAVSMINDQLLDAELPRLNADDERVLRDPAGYRALLLVLGSAADLRLSHAQALLDEWHAWNTRR